MNNVTNKDIKEKELDISNSNIKVHIPYSSVLLNLSTLNSIKQKFVSSPISFMLDPIKNNPQTSFY